MTKFLHIGVQEENEKVQSQLKLDLAKTSREEAVEKAMECLNAAFDLYEDEEGE